MYNHHGSTYGPFVQQSLSKEFEGVEIKNIFAGIVEIEQASDRLMRQSIPVIALYDSSGLTNWVSQKFVDDISSLAPTANKCADRLRRRSGGDFSHIYIRWTCRKLGLYSQGGLFYIEPKANFKILFGCGNITSTDLRRRSIQLPSLYHKTKEETRQQTEPALSRSVINIFRREMNGGMLLPLKTMPALLDKGTSYLKMDEIEAELNYIFLSYSKTDDALNITHDEDSISCHTVPGNDFLDMQSSRDSLAQSESSWCIASTNSSVSEESYRGRRLSEQLRKERGQPTQRLEKWLDQDVYEEPQIWIPRLVEQRQSQGMFTQCSGQSDALAAAREEARVRTADYWQWDEIEQNYKHFESGSTQPIWYNPPGS